MFFRDLLQPTHLLIILAIVLLIVGPGKLVGLGGALGSSIRDFKRATRDDDEEEGVSNKTASGNVKSIADDGEEDAPVRPAIPAVVPSSNRMVDEDEEAVTVPAGRTMSGVVNETGAPIKVGTTRKAYGRR